jgi:hypothetical protein
VNVGLTGLDGCKLLVIDQADIVSQTSQPEIGVLLA